MRAIKLLKRFAAVILAVAGLMMFSGCGADGANGGNIVEAQIDGSGALTAINRASKPIHKPGGGKFTLAYVDIDPYNETFRMLYYVIESLKDDGWISYGELPFDPETDSDSLALMDWLADNAESDYMAFDKTAHYYTTVSSEEEIRESLQKHIENHEIDAILSMGTSPSLMLERFGFDIPLLMYAVSDPIGSGLIESADDSGNKNYWAHVDSSAYSRQMQYYYDTFGFSKIGSVYGDEIVCAIPDYTSVAEENGFTIVGYKLEREAFADEDEYYNRLESIYRRMVREDGGDAYILNTDVIPSVEKAAELMKIFYDANIPVVAQVGSAYVKGGAAMMIVDPRDAVGTGPFVSNIIGSVFNGSVPEDLEQEYVSSPFLTLNLDVADEIGYKPSFEMLIACEKIICSE